MAGPCEWPVSYAACSDPSLVPGADQDQLSMAEQTAIDQLWRWTGRVFGTCPVTYRPCRVNRVGRSEWTPVMVGGIWANAACGVCAGARGCTCEDSITSLRLPGPVQSIESVVVDGVELPTTSYRLEGNLLIRHDGDQWPSWQNLSSVPGTPGTWEVNYTQGVPVPMGGQLAAGALALELVKAMCNDNTCQLPKRIQTITRQGVTVTMLDAFEGLEEGKTGIWIVDSWVASIIKPKRGGQVYSVDVPRKRFIP